MAFDTARTESTSPSPSKPAVLQDYLTDVELCEDLRICRKTLRAWRSRNDAPKVTLIGNRNYTHKADIAAWLAKKNAKAAR